MISSTIDGFAMSPSDADSQNVVDSQALLRLAQQRFSNLIRSLPVGIVICGRNGLIEAVNPTVVRLFGYEERQLVRQPRYRSRPLRRMRQPVLERRGLRPGQLRVVRRRGGLHRVPMRSVWRR